MKLVVAFIQPQMQNDVVFALHEIEGLPGASLSDGRGFGKWRLREEPEDVDREPTNFRPHVRIEIVCDDALVDTVVKRICDAARTDSTSDGIVCVQDVDRLISIRTGCQAE